jgi:hypothetical protein
MTLLINIQINLLFKRKCPIGLTSKFGNLVWPNARAALVLQCLPCFIRVLKVLILLMVCVKIVITDFFFFDIIVD